MRFFRTVFLLAALASAGGAAHAQTGVSVAAIVNDELISTYDVQQRAALLLAFSNAERTPEVIRSAMDQALRSLIDERLQLQEANSYELTIDEETIDAALENIAEQSGADLNENLTALAEAGVPESTLREQLRAQIAWDRLIQGRYRDRVRISSDLVDEAMEEMVQALQEPQYRVAELFFAIDNVNEEQEALARAQGALEQLAQGGSFSAVAQQFSDAESAQRGGILPYQPLSAFPPAVADILSRMQPDRISVPIRAPGGYYVVALVDKRDAASAEQLTLKAIVLPIAEDATADERETARADLQRAAERAAGCDTADAVAERVEGAFVSDLGELSAASLQPQVRQALAGLQPGEATDAISSQLGAQVFMLCDRTIGGPGIPTRQEIAARMEDQRRSMLSRRYLRDLHREAAIKYPEQ